MIEREELLIAAEEFLRVKYIARADSRQKSMGLAYIEAERSDLAKEICNFIERRGLLNPASQPSSTGLPAPASHAEVREELLTVLRTYIRGHSGNYNGCVSMYLKVTDVEAIIRALALPQSTERGGQ